jgi:uncharacterized protein YjeT (DUF2065 family)
MRDLAAAVGIALVLEGAAYMLFPGVLRRAAALLFAQGEQAVRLAGLAACLAGLAVTIAARNWGA